MALKNLEVAAYFIRKNFALLCSALGYLDPLEIRKNVDLGHPAM